MSEKCKHASLKLSDYDLMWCCTNPDCAEDFDADEVVIITKAQYRLMQSVISSSASVEGRASTFNDGGYIIYAVDYDSMSKLISDLKEYRGEK